MLRPQVSDALVVRGDEFLYRAQSARALSYYARALAIDPDNGAAADRFAFVALTSREPRAIAQSLREATAYLARHPGDAVVLMDRAMAYRAVGNARAALADFALAGARAADPRAFAFAGFMARQLGEAGLAARYWRAALALRPGFVPALRALARAR
jgi:tetratricopeptide (TPR) repeat protein